MAVVASPELDHLRPARGGPGQAKRAHGGLGPGVHQADHLHRGHQLHHQLGQLDLPGGGSPEGGPQLQCLVDGPSNPYLVVAQDHGTPGPDEVQVAVPVGIGDPGSLGPDDEEGIAAHTPEGPHRAVHPPGDGLLGPLEELLAQLVLVAPFRHSPYPAHSSQPPRHVLTEVGQDHVGPGPLDAQQALHGDPPLVHPPLSAAALIRAYSPDTW